MILTDFLTNLRADLADSSPPYRWSDTVLSRETDRALDRYSYFAPRLQVQQIPAVPHCRLYAVPTGVWWVERVEWPLGRWPKRWVNFRERTAPSIGAPTAPPAVSLLPSGALSAGVYGYRVTFTTPGGGETNASPVASIAVQSGQGAQLPLPVGPYGVTGRTVYRSAAGSAAGGPWNLLAAVPDNSTVEFLDITTSDGQLGAGSAPLTNSTQGAAQFELLLDSGDLPVDAADWIEVTTAAKHQLDSSGTSVPEQHWDCLYLGAAAYAIGAYLASINDNFEWADGVYRDRVDDTASVVAWRAQEQELLAAFEARLVQIRNQSQSVAPQIAAWGDKPLWWDRL